VILTTPIIIRVALLVLVTALAQVACFSGMVIFGTSPDVAILVVISLGLLGGSVTGAVSGFSTGLLIDCLLLQTLGAFALSMLAVGYAAGRYRENVGRPTRGAVPLLGGAFTFVGLVAFAAIQVGTGVDADVSTIVIRDAAIKTLIGAALAIPVLLLVRLLVRPALIDDRPSARRPMAPRTAEAGPNR
jgi:rod shape-determining protein MreD